MNELRPEIGRIRQQYGGGDGLHDVCSGKWKSILSTEGIMWFGLDFPI